MFGRKKQDQDDNTSDAAIQDGRSPADEDQATASEEHDLFTAEQRTQPLPPNDPKVAGNVAYTTGAAAGAALSLGNPDPPRPGIADRIAEAIDEDNPDSILAAGSQKWVPKVTKDKAINDLNGMIVEGLEEIAGKMGTYTTDNVAGGDYLAVLRGNIRKSRLFNEILDDDRLMIDPKRLYEFTIAESQRRHCLAEGIGVSNLKTYHFVVAYRVKDEEARLLLLDEANQNNWGVRRLQRAASEYRRKKSGVDAGKSILKMIGGPLKALEDPELVTMCSDKDRLLRVLSETERQQIRELIEDGKPHIEGWQRLVERLGDALNDIDQE